MRLRLMTQTAIMLMVLACFAATASAATSLGNHPFHQPPLTSAADFIKMVDEQRADVKKGMTIGGQGDLYETFMAQLADADIQVVEYAKGQRFEWMFYRKNGKGPVRVDKVWVWEADTPFKALEFYIDDQDQRYTFAVPLICGNLALKDISPIPAPVVVAPTPEPVKEAPVEAAVAPVEEEAAGWPIVMDLGYLYQVDPANHLVFRVGLEHEFNENFSILGMIGAAPKLSGTDGTSAFIADVFANYNWDRVFVGLGLGAWITDGDSDNSAEDSDLDLIFNLGTRVYEKPESYDVSAFLEVRSGVDELDEFDLYGIVGAGIRIRF